MESNPYFLHPLKERIKNLDLEEVYTPIIGHLEDEKLLNHHDIVPESLDCILSIQVFCSVSADLEATTKLLYKLLKPGGQIILWEHQASHDFATRIVQKLYNSVWAPTIGGCYLDREIETALRGAGRWKRVELDRDEERPWAVMPRVWGRLVKASE